MNSTTFILGNMLLELGMEPVVWILMELNAYNNLFVHVRYDIHPPLVVKEVLEILVLLVSTQYQCSENDMFYRVNQPRTAIHFIGVNAQRRFFC